MCSTPDPEEDGPGGAPMTPSSGGIMADEVPDYRSAATWTCSCRPRLIEAIA
jgi:hypothetical protein